MLLTAFPRQENVFVNKMFLTAAFDGGCIRGGGVEGWVELIAANASPVKPE